nr:hypothetical protein [Aeromonas caviae]
MIRKVIKLVQEVETKVRDADHVR